MSIWDWLLNPSGLTPHGFCLSWAPGLVALHAGSDAVIGLAYLSIPLALASLVSKRPDIQYGWVAYLFGAFIVACGVTHLLSIVTLWVPAYGIEGLVKLVTALLSIATAAILWPLIPKVVALPSAAQLARVNDELATTVREQAQTAMLLRKSESQVRSANAELESRVAQRTSELLEANGRLTEALAERARAQQALVASEEAFRISFEAAAVGETQAQPLTGQLIRVNKAFAHMLGYEPEEMVGRTAWDFTWPEDRESERAEYARVVAEGGNIYVREKRYLRRNGEPIWGRVSATVVRAPETGEPSLAIGVIENIDARYKAQVELSIAKQHLEGALAERTGALVQRDLLLREVYHRVKNNLQIVDSLLVMQSRQFKDPDVRAALTSLRSRVFALGLVHHQLIGSKDLRTFDIGPFLQELSTNTVKGGADREVRLSVRAAPLHVGLDFAIPLGLIVTELLTNSLKHAFPSGGGEIDVTLDQGEDGMVVLAVADNGVGTAQAATDPPKPGLGKTIIRGLVAQLRGTIAEVVAPGTRIEIRVPAPVTS
jgi:PAS domain S-box-containing protein